MHSLQEPANSVADHRSATSRDEYFRIGSLTYRARRWGNPAGRPLVLLHGARDCAATFQFMVESLRGSWNILAPDWRGHGLSDRAARAYWAHDFLADLDAFIDNAFAQTTIDLVGHSMGGNIASLYLALRPDRVRHFVSLDAFGPLAHRLPVDMPTVLSDYLKPWPEASRHGYDNLSDVADRLMKANPRLTRVRADFLAEHSTGRGTDGRLRWLFDPGMKHSLPTLHSVEEWAAMWARITTPVLWIGSSDPRHGMPAFDGKHRRRTEKECSSTLNSSGWKKPDITSTTTGHRTWPLSWKPSCFDRTESDGHIRITA